MRRWFQHPRLLGGDAERELLRLVHGFAVAYEAARDRFLFDRRQLVSSLISDSCVR